MAQQCGDDALCPAHASGEGGNQKQNSFADGGHAGEAFSWIKLDKVIVNWQDQPRATTRYRS